MGMFEVSWDPYTTPYSYNDADRLLIIEASDIQRKQGPYSVVYREDVKKVKRIFFDDLEKMFRRDFISRYGFDDFGGNQLIDFDGDAESAHTYEDGEAYADLKEWINDHDHERAWGRFLNDAASPVDVSYDHTILKQWEEGRSMYESQNKTSRSLHSLHSLHSTSFKEASTMNYSRIKEGLVELGEKYPDVRTAASNIIDSLKQHQYRKATLEGRTIHTKIGNLSKRFDDIKDRVEDTRTYIRGDVKELLKTLESDFDVLTGTTSDYRNETFDSLNDEDTIEIMDDLKFAMNTAEDLHDELRDQNLQHNILADFRTLVNDMDSVYL
jgi:hypothetical protein